jgi:uncharacterized membrane protein YccC
MTASLRSATPSVPLEPPPPQPDVRLSRMHVARTSVGALAALLVVRLVGLPEPYWAAITTLVVMQSSLAASWTVSWKRMVGTAIGAIVGGTLATFFPSSDYLFAVALLVTGLLCVSAGLDRVAYRFTGITLAIITLVARSRPGWIIASHRFAEVSIGIAIGLLVTAVWPEKAEGGPVVPASP